MKLNRKELGNFGEQFVARWYEQNGYEIIDRQWRVRSGEIDLVAHKNSLIVFCEVKTRSSNAFGTPAEAVSKQKQLRLRKLAMEWLRMHGKTAKEIRFDVACVMPSAERKEFECQVITNAF